MWKKRFTLAKVILGGTIIFAAIPPTLYWSWGHVYAASNSSTVRSVYEISQKLTGAMNNRRETITFTYEGNTSNLKAQIQKALDLVMINDPYLNYIIDSYGYTYRGSVRSAKVTMEVKYLETLEQTAFVNKEVKTVLNKIITPGMDNHQKVKVIHDWVVLHLKYDTSYRNYTAYEGLKSGTAVCQGYSLLTYKLLKGAGITNKIVEGTAGLPGERTQSHAWNLVLLDGQWYHLDTTWDDPTPDKAGVVSNAYYMRTDTQMRLDHKWTKTYPAATTFYHKTLTALVERGGQRVGVYKQLHKELNYELYDEKLIVRSADDVVHLANKAIISGDEALLFRYRGSGAQLENILQELYKLGCEKLSYSSTAFETTSDLKVYVTWE